jgi:hypothetical protein
MHDLGESIFNEKENIDFRLLSFHVGSAKQKWQ